MKQENKKSLDRSPIENWGERKKMFCTQKFDDTQLYPLLFQNDFSKIKEFLDKYGLDSVDRDGRTFLTTAIFEHKNDIAEQLIKLGANINQMDNDGDTPLFAAIRAKNLEMLEELFNDPLLDKNAQNNHGKNAIGIALEAHKKDNALMIMLINHGISPFVEDKNENSPYSKMKKYDSGEITIGGNKLDIAPVIQKIDELFKNK